MSNMNEIEFYRSHCPELMRDYVPCYRTDFFLEPGKDCIELEEEFDISIYCPTSSVLSFNSSQSSLDSNCSGKELQTLIEE
jgi:hypothetical protein